MSDSYNKELIKDPFFKDIKCSSKSCFMHLDYEFTTNQELWTSQMVRNQSRLNSRRFAVQSPDRPNWSWIMAHTFGQIKKDQFSILQSKNDRVQIKISEQIKAASEFMKINDVLLAGLRKKENQKIQLRVYLTSSFTGYSTIRGNSNFYKCKGWIQTSFYGFLTRIGKSWKQNPIIGLSSSVKRKQNPDKYPEYIVISC